MTAQRIKPSEALDLLQSIGTHLAADGKLMVSGRPTTEDDMFLLQLEELGFIPTFRGGYLASAHEIARLRTFLERLDRERGCIEKLISSLDEPHSGLINPIKRSRLTLRECRERLSRE